MKVFNPLFPMLLLFAAAPAVGAETTETVKFGDTAVFYDYRATDTGTAILTLNAVVSETNDSLRGLKNSDRRRLSKLGQLIYQCKLMLYKADKRARAFDNRDPILVSKNFSLFTGVDLPLGANERVGIQARALRSIDEASLFSASLGAATTQAQLGETVVEGAVTNLKQFDINVFSDTDFIQSSESIDIVVRFPVFQLETPVSQWRYNFNLRDFKRAHRHIEQNCTASRLIELIQVSS